MQLTTVKLHDKITFEDNKTKFYIKIQNKTGHSDSKIFSSLG